MTRYGQADKWVQRTFTQRSRGGLNEQLVVPRPYISKVVFMAHSHLLGAHIGMDKTKDSSGQCRASPEDQPGT